MPPHPTSTEIDRDTLDAPGWIALIGAACQIREAEHALARLIGKHPAREYRSEFGDVTTDPKVAEGWSDAALEADYRDPGADWRPFNYEGTEAVTADRIAYYAAREAALAGKDA